MVIKTMEKALTRQDVHEVSFMEEGEGVSGDRPAASVRGPGLDDQGALSLYRGVGADFQVPVEIGVIEGELPCLPGPGHGRDGLDEFLGGAGIELPEAPPHEHLPRAAREPFQGIVHLPEGEVHRCS